MEASVADVRCGQYTQRTRFGEMACSIARTLDVIGEP